MEKICVAVRVRPPSSDDSSKGNHWKLVDNTISLCSPFGTPVSGQSFAFDYVFGAGDRNGSIYELHTSGVITAAVRGFNGTVFAYGQTSSGKTYTMRGSKADPGLIGLAVHDVFGDIQKIVDREFLIRVSYMEIYNEDINDLLAPENRKLQIHENLEKGIFVAGLREEIVNSPEQVLELLEFGEAHRHVGQTNMNVYSSRSHTIFRMVIESKDKYAESGACSLDAVRVSVLNLVDLAGSERVAKTGAGGVRLKEGTHINKSLMTLGNVIKKLSDGSAKQGGHIPYRDSKLTRILQPALGGNAKTAIICTVAPDEVHIDETRGTLQFASRAKRVMTCAQVNEILTDAALLKRQRREIEGLRKKLQGFRSEVLEQEILHLRNDLLKYELEREKLALELQEERKAHLERERHIKEQERKIENLSSLVITSALDDALNKVKGRDSSLARRLSLELPNQDFRKHIGRGPLENPFENRLITVRRERLQSPLNFEALSDKSGEKDGKFSKWTGDIPVPPDFGNVADEDLWFSLNDGHASAEPDFLLSTPNRRLSSVSSTKARKASSMYDALKSSRVEVERYKSQLDEVLKENMALRNQLQEQFSFQKQLENELSEMESEFCTTKCMTETVKEFWDVCRQAEVSTTATLQNFLAEEKSLSQSAILCADELISTRIQSLEGRIRELELELLNYKQENSELRRKSQAFHEKLQCSHVPAIRGIEERFEKEDGLQVLLNCREEGQTRLSLSPVQEAGAPFVFSDCRVGKYCSSLSSPDGHLSNDGTEPLSTPKASIDTAQRLAFKMSDMDIWSGNMQKDHDIHVSDGNWLTKQKGEGFTSQTDKEKNLNLSNTIKGNEMHSTDQEFASQTDREKISNQRKTIQGDEMHSEDQNTLIEKLHMSREHIMGLEQLVLLANLEKDRTCRLLKEQIYVNEESRLAMKLEKLKFAKELKKVMDAIAVQDSFVTAICHGIEEFEKGMDLGSPNLRRKIPQTDLSLLAPAQA